MNSKEHVSNYDLKHIEFIQLLSSQRAHLQFITRLEARYQEVLEAIKSNPELTKSVVPPLPLSFLKEIAAVYDRLFAEPELKYRKIPNPTEQLNTLIKDLHSKI